MRYVPLCVIVTSLLILSCSDEEKAADGPTACFASGLHACHMLFAGEDVYMCDEAGTTGELAEDCDDTQYCRPDANGEPSCSALSLCYVICEDDCFASNPTTPTPALGASIQKGA